MPTLITPRLDQKIARQREPIPQVDQMPAGLISVFLLSREVRRQGRDSFNAAERAIVELSRYRCYLLGLPEELLAETPQGIIDMWLTRAATLRAGFDDATCGALVRATMAADLLVGSSIAARIQSRMERSFAKLFFVQNFANKDRAEAKRVGINLRAGPKQRRLRLGIRHGPTTNHPNTSL